MEKGFLKTFLFMLFTIVASIGSIVYYTTFPIPKSPKFVVGDCILHRDYGYWEIDFIREIKAIDNNAKIYGVGVYNSKYITSISFSDVEYFYRKVECPN